MGEDTKGQNYCSRCLLDLGKGLSKEIGGFIVNPRALVSPGVWAFFGKIVRVLLYLSVTCLIIVLAILARRFIQWGGL
jgi:hypothetical protein